VSPVVMRKRHTSVRWRNPRSSRHFRSAIGMLILAFAGVSVKVGMVQDEKQDIMERCRIYQDPKSIEPLKKVRHPALDKGCAACHLDCSKISAIGEKQPLLPYFLKEKEPGLCLECHTPDKYDLPATHDNQPLGEAKCSGCHDAHSANQPKRLPDFSHGPYDARLCSACHPAPLDGKVRLTAANANALCYGCHEELKTEIDSAKSRHKLLSQSDTACLECHDPHASNQRYILKKPTRDLCISCHDENAEKANRARQSAPPADGQGGAQGDQPEKQYLKLSSKHVHEPVRESCTICHKAHASNFSMELRASVNDVCMSCHGANAEKIIQSEVPFPLFGGQVSLRPNAFSKVTFLDLSAKYVHEPVRTSCVYCHDAHASQYQGELYEGVHDLCLACHGVNADEIVRGSKPVDLFDGRVTVPPKTFSKLSPLLSVKDGMTGHPILKHPIYKPATANEPELNCLTCHHSHISTTSSQLLVKSKDVLCSECHKM
jgi:predicted CXXCH cytochrome family protein